VAFEAKKFIKINKGGWGMNYATIKPVDIADGEGVRVSLFVSGCRHHCKNCFNKVAWNFGYGTPWDKNVEDQLLAYLAPNYISGLTLLGGEPFEPENQPVLVEFLKKVREKFPSKNIWCYTGFTLDKELLGQSRAVTPYTMDMLKNIDVLVDGRFVEEKKSLALKFRGSSNQRIIDVPASLKSGKIVEYALHS
jgi:anaerobic ribonucleoside-triphosphate reductase activating protein